MPRMEPYMGFPITVGMARRSTGLHEHGVLIEVEGRVFSARQVLHPDHARHVADQLYAMADEIDEPRILRPKSKAMPIPAGTKPA